MKFELQKRKVLIASAILSAMSATANAQEVALDESGQLVLEELVVTAQRREESLQSAPVAVTALSADLLAEKQITNVLDLQYAAPNLSLATNTGTANGARLFIRGAGEDESRASAEPAVGVYVDDVYIGRAVGALFDLVDLEQVEVLRGPQGTLYGRNSNGGAIRLNSVAPSTEDGEYDLAFTAGSDGRFDARATGNFVLGEKTALRASFLSRSRDGFHTLNPNGDFAALAGQEVGEIDTQAVRLSFLHQFNDQWSANLILDRTDDDSDPIPDSLNTDFDADNNIFTIEPVPGTTCSAATPANFLGVGCFSDYSSEVESQGGSLKVVGEYDNYTFKSITGVRTLEDELSTRIGFPFNQETDQDQFSQEFTITSNFDSNFNYVAGLFFFEEDIQLNSTFVIPFELGVETSAQAAFFQGTYEFGEKTSLTGGVRYTDEEKSIDGLSVVTGLSRVETRDFTNTTYRINLDHQFSDNVFAYVSYSTGFKSGGWSPDCFSPAGCFLPVDEEELDTFEVGIRSTLFNNRVRLNATLFSNTYDDLQIGATVPDLGFTRLNVDEAEIDGFELEASFLLSENFSINTTIGLLDAEYSSLTEIQAASLTNGGASPGCNGVPSVECGLGLQLKNAPDYKGSVGLVYTSYLNNGELTANLDFSFEDESFNLAANIPNSVTDVSTLINARIAYAPNDSGWRFAVWGQNITDEEFARASTGATTVYASAPATYGVDVGYRF